MVVDDVEAVASVFERALTAAGFTVERASNGRVASECLRRRTFDAIVSDVGMPEMDGIALLKVVRERDLDVPVLLVTGSPSVETAAKAVEYGALRYLCKPIVPKDLVVEMEKAVRLGRLARLKRAALELAGGASNQLGDRAGLELHFEHAVHALWTAYQPIVRYSERRVIAFEALMRSDEPKLPCPEALLGAADRLGKLAALGRAVRNHIGTTIAPTDVSEVFVNIHPTDLMDDDLFTATSSLSRIAARVVLEITERASLDHVRDLRSRVSHLRDLGFRIAIDDVGAGCAGLSSIAQLEPDVMKLDTTLVRDIDATPTKQRLVSAISELCSELNVCVIAEGVETPAERDTLVSLGCDLMQGYLFARPSQPFPEARF